MTPPLGCAPRPGVLSVFLIGLCLVIHQAATPEARAADHEAPAGFVSLFNGKDLAGWKVPEGDNGHWKVADAVIDYDAASEGAGDKSLWSEREYGDFVLRVDWRIKETPYTNGNVFHILPDGSHGRDVRGRELRLSLPDSDSGICLRGSVKYQVNIWCWPIGSGEMYGVRTDPSMPPAVRAAATPRTQADKPVGQWNQFEITARGGKVTVVLNGKTVIPEAEIPGLPKRGRIALQHHGSRSGGKWTSPPALMQFRNLFIQELPSATSAAAPGVFSGPQPGERTTAFKVLEIRGGNPGHERDPITEHAGVPTALVFVHGIERSLVPLLRAVDEYGALRRERLKTELVFLAADRVSGEERVKAASGSLQLKAPVGLSVDGAEGPGNYGLNKECLMTIVAAKDNRVTANFALVQPGIADAPKVIEALAQLCGDTSPPPIEQLSGPTRMARGGENMAREAGKKPGARPAAEPFPGAVPDDARLNSLLRQFIRPTNDDPTVDRLLKDIEGYIQGDANLTRQASNGWVRVLHFGDHYGTAYSRKLGQASLDRIKAGSKAAP